MKVHTKKQVILKVFFWCREEKSSDSATGNCCGGEVANVMTGECPWIKGAEVEI